jgi:hypothetical protein
VDKSTEKWPLLVQMGCMAASQVSSDEEWSSEESGLSDEELIEEVAPHRGRSAGGADLEDPGELADSVDPTTPTEQTALLSTRSNAQSTSFFGEPKGYSRDFWFYFCTSASLAPPTMFLFCLMIFISDQVSLKEIFDPKEPYLAWLIATPAATLLLTVLCYVAAYLHITYAPISEETFIADAKPRPWL